MKAIIGFAAALTLTLPAISATAGDKIRALSAIPAGERACLTPLSDDQLAAVQGKEGFPHVLLQLPNPLFGLLDPATLAALGQTGSMNTQSSSQTQQNTSGGMQTNVNTVRQP